MSNERKKPEQVSPTEDELIRLGFVHLCAQYQQMGEQLKVLGAMLDSRFNISALNPPVNKQGG